jgi:cell division protease FtsH
MVCEWGMSDAMGPLSYGKKEEQIFLGREFATHKDYSEETAQRIDQEVTRLVSESYEKAKKLLSDHIDILNRIADGLLEKEVLNTVELDEIIQMNREEVDGSANTIPTEH